MARIDKRKGSTRKQLLDEELRKRKKKARPYGGPKDPTQGHKFDAPKIKAKPKAEKKTLKGFGENLKKDAKEFAKGLGLGKDRTKKAATAVASKKAKKGSDQRWEDFVKSQPIKAKKVAPKGASLSPKEKKEWIKAWDSFMKKKKK